MLVAVFAWALHVAAISLVPLSVEAAGLDLGDVLASLVRAASSRDARTATT